MSSDPGAEVPDESLAPTAGDADGAGVNEE